MGRNKRHKKELRSEKAKVKLKSTKTKFLPKGLNVTKTTFKVRSIVLPEQLKEKSNDVPLSKRKLNVNELVSRIKHYNENIRHSACEELCEMVKIYPDEIIQQHLSLIILAVSTLVQDREPKVRKSAFKAIKTVLEYTPAEKIEPFFGIISTNLRCAMTNIDKNIQEDSLLLLDVLLEHASVLVAKNSEKILPDFFTLISKLRTDSNLCRTLTVNLGSKLTSVKWRIKVLSRLFGILKAVTYETLPGSNPELTESDKTRLVIHVSDSTVFVPLYKNSQAMESHTNFINCIQQRNTEKDSVLNTHIMTLLPLLYETWIEVVPEKNVGGTTVEEKTHLNEESATILTCIMNIMYLLWEYVKKHQKNDINTKSVFCTLEGTKFFTHLLQNFPYSQIRHQSEKNRKMKSNKNFTKLLETNDDPKCITENLLICYLFSVIYIDVLKPKTNTEVNLVISYINKCLLTKKYINSSNVKYLILFLNSCLEQPVIWKNQGVNLDDLIDNIIVFYNNGNIFGKEKFKIMNILSKIACSPNVKLSSSYNTWLGSLPNLLCEKEISKDIVDNFLKLSKMSNPVFEQEFLNSLPDILGNLVNLNVINSENDQMVKKNIINILFYVKYLKKQHLDQISRFIKSNPDSDYSKYFINILELRNDLKYSKVFEEQLKMYPWWIK